MKNTTAVNDTKLLFMEDNNQPSKRKFTQQTAMASAGLMLTNSLQTYQPTGMSNNIMSKGYAGKDEHGRLTAWDFQRRPTGSCVFIAILALLAIQACSQSVETGPKAAPDQKPAFSGQTRVHAVKTKATFKISIITENLSRPWGLDFLPDSRMIVSELQGTIRIVSKDGKVGGALKGVPPVRVFQVSGMMDVKVAPDFETSRYVFWTYPEPVGENQSVNCVGRGKLSSDETSLEDVKVIYRASTPGQDGFHLGSRMLFDKSGLLYVSFADRFHESVRGEAQELHSSLGKIIRINQDGTYADGNPFISDPKAQKEIWSLGHRNPQGLALNPVTGDLWSSEHGPIAGDELNIIRPGSNYGWPIISYGLADSGGPLSGLTQKEGLVQPVYYWDPAVAPCGMAFYTGDLISEWKNNLFVGALRGSHIIRLVIDNSTSRIVGEERLLVDDRQRFRDIVQGPDNALYAITDQGRLYRLGN